MRLYNIEIFAGFSYRGSLQIQDVDYKEDYISLEKNKIKSSQEALYALEGDYIHIWGDDIDTWGIVTAFENKKGKRQITYENFLTVFDADIYCDISLLDTLTIESFLAELIRTNYIENADILQNIEGLSVEVLTGTHGVIDIDKNVCNLLEDVIIPVFSTYQIVVVPSWDIQKKKIILRIERQQASGKTIEADLPNVLYKNIVVRKTKEKLNKLVVVNEEDPNEKLMVYRSINGEITTEDKDRIIPVVFGTIQAKASGKKTFGEVALEKAQNKLKKAEYENLIELEIMRDDRLVNPKELKIGQQVNIISGDVSYVSILTGREISETEVLIFGTVRLDLTKSIRRNTI